MKKELTIAVVGGDLRQVHLANRLGAMGHKVYGMFFDKEAQPTSSVLKNNDITQVLPICDVIIFPLPITTDSVTVNAPFGICKVLIEDCLNRISPSAIVYGGRIDNEIMIKAHRRDIEIIDYLEREELAVLNAVPTAEGAVGLAMSELPVTLFGLHILIIGYGRISKVLSHLLSAFGAKVTVAARRYSDLAWIKINCCDSIHTSELGAVIHQFDVIYNTVPAPLLTYSILEQVKPDCLLIDLASKPGGVDFDAAASIGVKVIWALSLPGKVAPITAGEIIKDTILNSLHEKEVV